MNDKLPLTNDYTIRMKSPPLIRQFLKHRETDGLHEENSYNISTRSCTRQPKMRRRPCHSSGGAELREAAAPLHLRSRSLYPMVVASDSSDNSVNDQTSRSFDAGRTRASASSIDSIEDVLSLAISNDDASNRGMNEYADFHYQAYDPLEDSQRRKQSLRQEDQDALLALALQQEEEDFAAAAEAEENSRRELVDQLLNMNTPPHVVEDDNKTIHYQAPEDIEGDMDECDFSLVNDCKPDDMCAICMEQLCYGTAVSLRVCSHVFHLDCIDDALDHSKRCPQCRKDVRSEPQGPSPSGSMFVTRPVISRVPEVDGYHERKAIMIEYDIPYGIQKPYHDYPGVVFRGANKVAYLPNTREGNLLLNRLIYAFSRGLTFQIGWTDTTEKSVVRWASISHMSKYGDNKEVNGQYIEGCNQELDQLGVPRV
jgi:deltex-like protein